MNKKETNTEEENINFQRKFLMDYLIKSIERNKKEEKEISTEVKSRQKKMLEDLKKSIDEN